MKEPTRFLLQIFLFLPLLLALSFGHGLAAVWLDWLPGLFDTRTLNLTALLLSSVLAGLIVAALFAFPFFLLYGKQAVLACAAASVVASGWRWLLIGKTSGLPFVVATLALDISCLAILPPLAVWTLSRLRPNNSFKPKPLRGSA
jgi:hypothetical protein